MGLFGNGTTFVEENKLNPVYQAVGWTQYDDGSGGLDDINGNTIVSYDLSTGELMGYNLPFTDRELYKYYGRCSCDFETIREDAIDLLNSSFNDALERAEKIVESYRQDRNNYFSVCPTQNVKYPFNVQLIVNGYYCGTGKFCENLDDIKTFIESTDMQKIKKNTLLCLFSYEIDGYIAYYNMGDISFEELQRIYEQVPHPYIDMPGQKICDIGEYAQLEQSGKVRLSVSADGNTNTWKIYEINGIPENERNDSNVSFRTVKMKKNIK